MLSLVTISRRIMDNNQDLLLIQLAALSGESPEKVLSFINASVSDVEHYKFIASDSRIDPYSHSVLLHNIQTQLFSPYLQTFITDLSSACSHAEYIIQNWAQEDIVAKMNIRKVQNRQHQKNFRDKQKQIINEVLPELEAARIKWKDSIAQRKAAIEAWDAYVKACHAEFTNVVNGAQNGK